MRPLFLCECNIIHPSIIGMQSYKGSVIYPVSNRLIFAAIETNPYSSSVKRFFHENIERFWHTTGGHQNGARGKSSGSR